eukprot:gene6223-2840_t
MLYNPGWAALRPLRAVSGSPVTERAASDQTTATRKGQAPASSEEGVEAVVPESCVALVPAVVTAAAAITGTVTFTTSATALVPTPVTAAVTETVTLHVESAAREGAAAGPAEVPESSTAPPERMGLAIGDPRHPLQAFVDISTRQVDLPDVSVSQDRVYEMASHLLLFLLEMRMMKCFKLAASMLTQSGLVQLMYHEQPVDAERATQAAARLADVTPQLSTIQEAPEPTEAVERKESRGTAQSLPRRRPAAVVFALLPPAKRREKISKIKADPCVLLPLLASSPEADLPYPPYPSLTPRLWSKHAGGSVRTFASPSAPEALSSTEVAAAAAERTAAITKAKIAGYASRAAEAELKKDALEAAVTAEAELKMDALEAASASAATASDQVQERKTWEEERRRRKVRFEGIRNRALYKQYIAAMLLLLVSQVAGIVVLVRSGNTYIETEGATPGRWKTFLVRVSTAGVPPLFSSIGFWALLFTRLFYTAFVLFPTLWLAWNHQRGFTIMRNQTLLLDSVLRSAALIVTVAIIPLRPASVDYLPSLLLEAVIIPILQPVMPPLRLLLCLADIPGNLAVAYLGHASWSAPSELLLLLTGAPLIQLLISMFHENMAKGAYKRWSDSQA